MKKTLVRLIAVLAFVGILTLYILYVLENLPSILQTGNSKNATDDSQIQLSTVVESDDTAADKEADVKTGNEDGAMAGNETNDGDDFKPDDGVDDTNVVSGEPDAQGKVLADSRERGNENGEPGQTDAMPDREGSVENDVWRAVNRRDSYNNELQYYTQDNVTLDNGRITIITKKEKKEDKNYTSGMVVSKYAYLYGYFSFRIKVSEGKGLFPAIWLLPAEDKKLPEIDIFEMIGSYPTEFYGVLHYGSTAKPQREYFCEKVAKKEFYEVALKWTKNELSWYIDGRRVFRTDKGIPNEPMYLIINQAIGGNWPGKPDDTKLPATFIVEPITLEPELSIEL